MWNRNIHLHTAELKLLGVIKRAYKYMYSLQLNFIKFNKKSEMGGL